MNNPIQLAGSVRSDALAKKIAHLRALPPDKIQFEDMLYLTPGDERRFGKGTDQENDPMAWGQLTAVEQDSAPTLSGHDAALTFRWILAVHFLMVAVATCVTVAFWPFAAWGFKPWGMPIACGVWSSALLISYCTTQVGIKRFTTGVLEPLSRAQNEGYPWRVVRQLAITFMSVRESPVLMKGFDRSQVVIDWFDNLFGKKTASPNSFRYLLEELRMATIFAMENFQSQTPKKGLSDAVTAENRFDQMLKSPISKMEALKGRWFWGIKVCEAIMIAAVSLGLFSTLAVFLKPN